MHFFFFSKHSFNEKGNNNFSSNISSHANQCYLYNLYFIFLFCPAGVVLMDISEVHRKVHLEMEENVSVGFDVCCQCNIIAL